MSDYVSLTLDDGSQVLLESAGTELVAPRSGEPSIVSADEAVGRLEAIAAATQQLCASLRSRLEPDEVQVEVGGGLSGESGWFFARSTAAGNLKVALTWTGPTT